MVGVSKTLLYYKQYMNNNVLIQAALKTEEASNGVMFSSLVDLNMNSSSRFPFSLYDSQKYLQYNCLAGTYAKAHRHVLSSPFQVHLCQRRTSSHLIPPIRFGQILLVSVHPHVFPATPVSLRLPNSQLSAYSPLHWAAFPKLFRRRFI